MSSCLRATFPSYVVTQYSSHIIHEILTFLMRKMFLLVLKNIQSSRNRPSFKFGVRDCFGKLVQRHAGECKYISNRLCDPIASRRKGVTTLLDGEGETCRAAKGRHRIQEDHELVLTRGLRLSLWSQCPRLLAMRSKLENRSSHTPPKIAHKASRHRRLHCNHTVPNGQ